MPDNGPYVPCEHCDDTGSVRSPGAEDYGVSFESEYCDYCRYGKALIALDAAEWEVHEARAAAGSKEPRNPAP
jgi:hypothetical protein